MKKKLSVFGGLWRILGFIRIFLGMMSWGCLLGIDICL
jgi:hypothetical protein